MKKVGIDFVKIFHKNYNLSVKNEEYDLLVRRNVGSNDILNDFITREIIVLKIEHRWIV